MFSQKIDNTLQRAFGIPYLVLTRDFFIHERCHYLMSNIAALFPNPEQRFSMLDVGCGSGTVLRYLQKFFGDGQVERYHGFDRNVSRLRERYDDIHSFPVALRDIDLDDDWTVESKFDMAWCAEVLEHLIDDVGVLRKIARAVKPGGVVVLTVPSLPSLRHVGEALPDILAVSPVQDGGHVRLGYDEPSLRALAASAGLVLERVDGISRADVARVRRRFFAGPLVARLDSVRQAITSTREDKFILGQGYFGREREYHSIGAVLRVPMENRA